MDGRKYLRKFKQFKNKHNSWGFPQLNNLNYNAYEFDQIPSTSFTESEPDNVEIEQIDCTGRRIVLRESLYKDPDLFIVGNIQFKQQNINRDDNGFEWTAQNWQKAGQEETHDLQYNQCKISQRPNRVEKQLNKMLSQPVQMTKAERMMQKMGWQGGALGKHGEGIIEPIAPNASYATQTFGLGQTNKREKKAVKEDREYFVINVLLHVLEFVKNDTENELAFDRYLWKEERKRVHNIIQALANNGYAVKFEFDSVGQIDIAQEIHKYNHYILGTQSEGVVPNRFLCLYKEAPDHMYLVVPSDLREQDTDDNNTKINEKKVETLTENYKDDESTVETVLTKIIDYFVEFANDKNYTDFRFIGPFNKKEMEAINMFIAKCKNNYYGGDDKLRDAFQNKEHVIDIKENCNGTTFKKF